MTHFDCIICNDLVFIDDLVEVIMLGDISGWSPTALDLHFPAPKEGIFMDSIPGPDHPDFSVLDKHITKVALDYSFRYEYSPMITYIVSPELSLDVSIAAAALQIPGRKFTPKVRDFLRAIAYHSKYASVPEELKHLEKDAVEKVEEYNKLFFNEEYENKDFSCSFEKFLDDFRGRYIFPPFLRYQLQEYFNRCGAFFESVLKLLDDVEQFLEEEKREEK